MILPLMLFAVSGIVLNHREAVEDVQFGRKFLPEKLQYRRWNNGLLRNHLFGADSTTYLYGNNGVFRQTTEGYVPYNQGLPESTDLRNVRSMVTLPDGELCCATTRGLYRRFPSESAWQAIPLTPGIAPLSDLQIKGDSLLVLTRSELFTALPPYQEFHRLEFKASPDTEPSLSLFRSMMSWHTGQAWGKTGVFVVDFVALAFIVLAITGLIFFCLRKLKKRGTTARTNLTWHKWLGYWLFPLFLIVIVTGSFLRPPGLLLLVKSHIKSEHPNPWNDKLRCLRHDNATDTWLLSTSTGFYRLAELDSAPRLVSDTPPVSVMGVNVWEKEGEGAWIVGSLSGLYRWNSQTGEATDWFTGEEAPKKSGPPFGKRAVIGWSPAGPVEYYDGISGIAMAEDYETLPISLWNLALEVHTGRIFTFLGPFSDVYIFLVAVGSIVLVISGFRKIRKIRRLTSEAKNGKKSVERVAQNLKKY